MGTRRVFTDEFKEQVLREAAETGCAAAVLRKYGLSKNAVYEWGGQSAYSGRDKAQALVDGGHVITDRTDTAKAKMPMIQVPSDYMSFLRKTYPKTWMATAPHIKMIARHLDAVERGEIDRLAIHMPPRHSKTETATVRYAVYCLTQDPTQNLLVTGYSAAFARRLGRKARNIAGRFLELDEKVAASDEWATKAGGMVMTRGVGSPPTGVGFRRIIIDDPVRRHQDAESEVYRERVWDWYTDDLYTRLEPKGAIVLIMTLWHEDDLGARAIASEPDRWTVLKLPALAEENDALGRAVGAALWPARFDVDALERIHGVMRQNEGERSWQALYQQNPTPREGAFFNADRLDIVSGAPANMARIWRAWDMASSAGSGAYTAGVKMGTDGNGLFYVLDVVRGQWATDERDRQIRQTATLDGHHVQIRGPQDPGAAGVQAAQAFARLLAGFSVRTERVSGDKETRADPFSSQVNAGNVKLVQGSWNRAFVEELRGFPAGKFKDQVDAAADAFSELVAAEYVGHPVAGGERTIAWSPALAQVGYAGRRGALYGW